MATLINNQTFGFTQGTNHWLWLKCNYHGYENLWYNV